MFLTFAVSQKSNDSFRRLLKILFSIVLPDGLCDCYS